MKIVSLVVASVLLVVLDVGSSFGQSDFFGTWNCVGLEMSHHSEDEGTKLTSDVAAYKANSFVYQFKEDMTYFSKSELDAGTNGTWSYVEETKELIVTFEIMGITCKDKYIVDSVVDGILVLHKPMRDHSTSIYTFEKQ